VINVERVDYIRVPVTDIEQAKHFYGKSSASSKIPTLRAATGSSTRPAT
jgi:hypothetical protein